MDGGRIPTDSTGVRGAGREGDLDFEERSLPKRFRMVRGEK